MVQWSLILVFLRMVTLASSIALVWKRFGTFFSFLDCQSRENTLEMSQTIGNLMLSSMVPRSSWTSCWGCSPGRCWWTTGRNHAATSEFFWQVTSACVRLSGTKESQRRQFGVGAFLIPNLCSLNWHQHTICNWNKLKVQFSWL